MAHDPISRFEDALARARSASLYVPSAENPTSHDPTSMTLATCDVRGYPSARVVLLKHVDERGFVFYTNRESRKGLELRANPMAALCFLFHALTEQVRVEGRAEPVSDEDSDGYFATRPRESQLGAWASDQSRAIASREELVARLHAVERRFEGQVVPRPPHWGGYRVVPHRIEFWKEGKFRIHDRDVYRKDEHGKWHVERLQP